MKRLLYLLFTILLCSCSFRRDYNTLYIDDYKFSIGYDDVNYLKVVFDVDIKDELEVDETVENVEVRLFNKIFCTVDISNNKDKIIDSGECIISKLTLYCLDVGNRDFKINDVWLDSSVKSNCKKLNGTYIERNGYACVVEENKNNALHVIELHGDILNMDQDKLDHIILYIKQ